MTILPLCAPPPTVLAQALTRFEAEFTYPLGPGRTFRISHGEDYPRFFRAMGEAACFAAARQGCIVGTLGAALRPLLLPDGQARVALYLGDLKITRTARGGKVLMRLIQAVQQWVQGRAQVAYSVVMDGTPATPTRYTGRLGIPRFQELGKIIILQVPTEGWGPAAEEFATTEEAGSACYRRLSAGRCACPGGTPAERSEMAPRWLMTPDGAACGRLEDTRRAKRLIADDGTEMRSAHLSCFAYGEPEAGAALLREALRRAGGLGFPALFVAIAPPDAPALGARLARSEIVVAPATIYGAGLEPGPLWNINTAEI